MREDRVPEQRFGARPASPPRIFPVLFLILVHAQYGQVLVGVSGSHQELTLDQKPVFWAPPP